jgi:hypothetical protein
MSAGTFTVARTTIDEHVSSLEKDAIDTVRIIILLLSPLVGSLDEGRHAVCAQLRLLAQGVSHSDSSFASSCANAMQLAFQLFHFDDHSTTALSTRSTFSGLLSLLKELGEHSSWRIRELVMGCGAILLHNNMESLESVDRKAVSALFSKGLLDARPEVRLPAKRGMTLYLCTKPLAVLSQSAAIYEKNCNAFADRELKRIKMLKRAGNGSMTATDNKPDDTYTTTLMMTACIILAFPYDLPSFVPSLLSAFMRHTSFPGSIEQVMNTAQEFRVSHQDRWDEFKLHFRQEQLDALKGAGSQSYFI